MYKVIIAVVILTLVFLVAFSGVEAIGDAITGGNNNTTSYVEKSTSNGTVQVTLTGEVNRSGTYTVQLETTLGDLLEAAGGATSNADYLAFNASLPITSKNAFYIAPIYDNTDTCTLEPIPKVCINTASQSDLASLSAFSVTVATAIVNYRESNGEFQQIEKLKDVPGIGSATFEKCKNYVTLYVA